MQGMVDLGIAHPYRKDTACYRNTSILEEFWDMYGDDFEAGHHCWNYKAYFQTHNPNDKTKNIRWVLPTLKYLSKFDGCPAESDSISGSGRTNYLWAFGG